MSCSLPPIDSTPTPPPAACQRDPADAAALDAELEELHAALGVKRGHALQEALKPQLIVPTPPLQPATRQPINDASAAAAATATSATGGAS